MAEPAKTIELRGAKGDKGDKGEPGTPAHLTYQARRDGYIQAAMIMLGPQLLNMQLDEGEASKVVLVVADSMMAAADKEKP